MTPRHRSGEPTVSRCLRGNPADPGSFVGRLFEHPGVVEQRFQSWPELLPPQGHVAESWIDASDPHLRGSRT